MSMDPQMMQQYMQMFGGGPKQASPMGASSALAPMLQALMLAKMRKQNQQQQPQAPLSPFAGGTGSNAAPGAGDSSLGAAEAANVS